MWSSVCYQLYWALRRPLRRKGSEESEADKQKAMDEKKYIEDRKISAEDAQKRAIFLSQTFFDWPNPIKFCVHHMHVMVNRNTMLQDIKHIGDAVNWNPIKHDLNDTPVEDVQEFNEWLKTNYPNIEVDTDDLHGKMRRWKLWKNELGYAKLWNGLMLITVLTLVVGVLTHFRVGIPSHACWILLWLYGGPVFRSKWLVNHSVHNKPCRSFTLWLLYELFRGVGWIILIVVYCGITLISVELFADFCGQQISLSPEIWVAVGAAILAVLVLVGLVARYLLHIIGQISCFMF